MGNLKNILKIQTPAIY